MRHKEGREEGREGVKRKGRGRGGGEGSGATGNIELELEVSSPPYGGQWELEDQGNRETGCYSIST